MDNIATQKQQIREKIREDLKSLSHELKLQESHLIQERLAQFIRSNVPEQGIIATYAGLNFEPNLLGLHAMLPEYRFVYPKCGDDRTMLFYEISAPERQLVRGYYGIREPDENSAQAVDTDQIDLFIVPAFSYTAQGLRLGKGGGYYDRVLVKASKEAPLVGAVFSIQLKSFLPCDVHDIPVDHVISGLD